MNSKLKRGLITSAILLALTTQASANPYDDKDCKVTVSNIQDKIEEEVEDAKARQEAGTIGNFEAVFNTIEACLSQIGGMGQNPFGWSNPFDGLIDKACNYALDTITANNPVTNAVNSIKISDPTGTGLFEYNPNISLNKSGEFKQETTVNKNSSRGDAWSKIEKKLPGKNEIWR